MKGLFKRIIAGITMEDIISCILLLVALIIVAIIYGGLICHAIGCNFYFA